MAPKSGLQSLSFFQPSADPSCVPYKVSPVAFRNNFVSNHVSSVPPNFVTDLEEGKESGYNNHLAWFMDIGKDRIGIIKQESGMNPLVALRKACKYLLVNKE